jgi:hypothetical protein
MTAAASSGPSASDITSRFSPTFLASIPADKVTAVFRTTGPLRLQTVISPTANGIEAGVLDKTNKRLLVDLDVDAQGKISTLQVKSGPALVRVTTPAQLQQATTGLGLFSTVLVASVNADGTCATSQTLGDQGPRPLGSMFKLYVLGAVVKQIQAGKLSWDTKLTVTAAVKSLPSGQLQDQPDGTTVTVQQAATLMISISDNTAADLLIGAVGQPALASAVAAMGNSHPSLLTPFLTTKQMFTLEWDDPSARAQWAAAVPGQVNADSGAVADPSASAVATRTALLAHLPTATPTVTTANTRPAWMDGVEWFASPMDICRAQSAIQLLAKTPAGAPVAAIMSKNPGVSVGSAWSYVGYKGGNDTGVLTGSWYLEPASGSPTVAIVQLSTADPSKLPDDGWYAVAAGGMLQNLPH